MSLSIFGLFGTEEKYVVGTHSMNKDLKLKLHSDVYPHGESVKWYINKYGWDSLLNKATRQPHLSHMNREQLRTFFETQVVEGGGKGKKYLQDDILIEVVSRGHKSKLPDNIINGVMSVRDIQNTLSKPTLSLYYHLWDNVVEDYIADIISLPQTTLVIDCGEVKYISDVNMTGKKLYKFNIDNKPIYISVYYSDIEEDISSHIDHVSLQKVKEGTKYFTPAGYKSLLQKLIRYQPVSLQLVGKDGYITVDATDACLSAFTLLYNHPGSFVPDLQRFVRGKESALKRLAISIVEDSYIEDPKIIADLLSNALVAQFIKDFSPPIFKIEEWMKALIEGMKSRDVYDYDTSRKSIVTNVKVGTTDWKLSSYVLGIIGSFQSDINMIESVKPIPRNIPNSTALRRPSLMGVQHSIDQHWQPNLVYFLPMAFVNPLTARGSTPFGGVMNEIWEQSSKLNSRHVDVNSEQSLSRMVINKAQMDFHLYNMGLGGPPPPFFTSSLDYPMEISNEYEEVKYSLHPSYVVSKIGIVYMKDRNAGTIMISLDPYNVDKISVSRKPTRGKGEVRVSEEVEDTGKEFFKEKLKTGINGVKGEWTDDGLEVTVDGMDISSYLNRTEKAFHFTLNDNKDRFSTHLQPKGVATNDLNFDEFSNKELSRAIYHIKVATDDILTFPTITRDGGGFITKDDVGAFVVINKIAIYNSFVLRGKEGKVGTFDVFNLHLLKEFIPLLIRGDCKELSSISQIADRGLRNSYKHQEEALTSLIKEKEGNKNHFIYIEVGMGKTYIICSYIAYLLQAGKLAQNIIYTLPKSAFKTVQHELSLWGMETSIIKPIGKDKNKWKVSSFGKRKIVNLIEHDHLRIIKDDLDCEMSSTLFIVDEVHKTLAQTQRTSAALSLASLSHEFIVLTGTPAINTDMTLLLDWLKLTVDFPVDINNFYIVFSSLVSSNASTGILVNKHEVFVEMDDEDTETFNKLVSKNIGGYNDKVSQDQMKKAFDMIYDVVDMEMCRIAVANIDDGVFMVSRSSSHQQRLKTILTQMLGSDDDIGLITKDSLFNLVKRSDSGPSIVITTIRMSEGYTLTKLGVMITSVYFSNLATREQLEGRIDRISQERDVISMYVVYGRLLDLVLSNYNYVKSISALMKILTNK